MKRKYLSKEIRQVKRNCDVNVIISFSTMAYIKELLSKNINVSNIDFYIKDVECKFTFSDGKIVI